MAQTVLIGSLISSGSVPTTALGGGVVSSSGQITVNTVTYMTASNPLTTTNPTVNGAIWANTASGEYFLCTNSASNANEWIGSSGSYVFPATTMSMVFATSSFTSSTGLSGSVTLTSTNRLGKTNTFNPTPTFTSSSNSGSITNIVNNGPSVTATYTQLITASYGNTITVGVTASYGAFSVSSSVACLTPYPNFLYAWGWGQFGNLGLNNITNYNTPQKVGTTGIWANLPTPKAGYETVGIQVDGTLWSWGNNAYGTLGTNDIVSRSSPVQVGALKNWSTVIGNNAANGIYAIKTDGTLWAWGNNYYGGLGVGDTANRSSPVQVGALTNWAKVAGAFAYQGTLYAATGLAVKTDGTLWTWGGNTYGTLGVGDTVHRSSPVQVGLLTNWSKVYSGFCMSFAIKTDGTLWSWGRNYNGGLGKNDAIAYSSPVQIGALTNWVSVGSHRNGVLAIKSDNTLWAWGGNGNYDLGLGDSTDRSSPVQVGALTNWSKATCGYRVSLAVKTDGTLWSWGSGTYGNDGRGGITSNSPVQVGVLTNWLDVSVSNHTMAVASS